MNNKGFTLVELLAVIVIMSVLGVVAYSSVTSYINTSKIKAEEKFLDEISTEIEAYLGLYGMSKFSEVDGTRTTLSKQVTSSTISSVQVWKLGIGNDDDFTLQDLINDLKTTDKFVNPRTEKKCSASDISIEVYKDSDYVYYYYVDMEHASGCPTLKNIDTRPESLR